MVSAFVLEKLYVAVVGHYGWKLVAIHNEIVSLLVAALLGLLAFRISTRFGLDSRLAFACGASVVIIVFTFPDNLWLYWEMSPQAYWLLFATIFILVEERTADGVRTRLQSALQAAAAFLMTYMEPICSLAFLSAVATTILVLKQRPESWKKFFRLALLPWLAAMTLAGVQFGVAHRRFPDVPIVGSPFINRTGLNGESLYYGDHLDIARRRDVARNNWPLHREYLFRWEWVFILGSISVIAVVAAYVRNRAPRIALETMSWLIGSWVLYAAVFSQAVVIHPYLYDVMLFVPLSVALFAIVPALVETLTGRTGAIVLIAVICAVWYALFQMRLYALRYPAAGTVPEPPVTIGPRWG